MSDGEDLDSIAKDLEDNVVGEVVDRQTSRLSAYERNASARSGKAFDELESSLHLGEKLLAHLVVSLAVPGGGLTKVAACCALNQ